MTEVTAPPRLGLPLNFVPTILARKRAEHVPRPLDARRWLIVRAVGGFVSVILEYIALTKLPLKTNAMIIYSSPAFIVPHCR